MTIFWSFSFSMQMSDFPVSLAAVGGKWDTGPCALQICALASDDWQQFWCPDGCGAGSPIVPAVFHFPITLPSKKTAVREPRWLSRWHSWLVVGTRLKVTHPCSKEQARNWEISGLPNLYQFPKLSNIWSTNYGLNRSKKKPRARTMVESYWPHSLMCFG